MWQEAKTGILFNKIDELNNCQRDHLEMLYSLDAAIKIQEGYLVPYENVARWSDEECEMFSIPERNPYKLLIRSSGDLGHNDLRYIIEVLKPNGECFINPKFNGAFLHITDSMTYRLSFDQYQLVTIAKYSNNQISEIDRKKIREFNLSNLSGVQTHAKKSNDAIDPVLSESNNMIVMPHKLSVCFAKDDRDGKYYAEPVILINTNCGIVPSEHAAEFRDLFAKRNAVVSVYKSNKDRTQFVFSKDQVQGLDQIKKLRGLSEADKERFTQQPREVFSEEVFYFNDAYDQENYDQENNDGEWIPEEGDFIGSEYSDRVTGVTAVSKSAYYGSGHKTGGWLPSEGEIAVSAGNPTEGEKTKGESKPIGGLPQPEIGAKPNVGISTKPIDQNVNGFSEGGTNSNEPQKPLKKSLNFALGIIDNFEKLGYSAGSKERHGTLDESAIRNNITLHKHQLEGVAWMYSVWRLGLKGVLLADDMGLGKTLQTLAFIAAIRKGSNDSSANKPVLIVAPTALLANWENEYKKFIEDDIFSDVKRLFGSSLQKYATGEPTPNKKKKLELKLENDALALTTYETLRDYQFSFAEIAWGIIIADEAQKIKNPSAGITKAIKAMKYDYVISLSGTPVENSWVDLWSIMDFVQPAKLSDLKTFKSKYISTLVDKEGNIEEVEMLGASLKENLNPQFLRRMKKDHLEGIPEKFEHKCIQEMPDYQSRRYMALVQNAVVSKMQPLQVIAKLRDISLHPDLGSKKVDAFCEDEPDVIIGQSARLISVFKILDDVQHGDEKALVFLVSKKMQLVLKSLIERKYGIKISNPVNGEMNGIARQIIIDRFNRSIGFNVLILSPEAAGVGFTITSANHVIHLSRTWNPAKEDQATDRAYRIGQEKDVHVYLPMACHKSLGDGGSFDERLDALLSYKRRLSENVLYPGGDNQGDGEKMYHQIIDTVDVLLPAYNWSITDVDTVVGDVFEQIITKLYDGIDGYSARKTPQSNDYGADVVVDIDDQDEGLLIQCKHKANPTQSLGNGGVQEIVSAVEYYKKLHNGKSFIPVVVTNAMEFTPGAIELAESNKVKLISRSELNDMLIKYPVLRDC